MGHTDIESTIRYLKPNRNKAVREKVNETFPGYVGPAPVVDCYPGPEVRRTSDMS